MAVATFCVLVSQFIFYPAYDTNDDMLMQAISSGVISGTPNPFLYLSSTLLGRILVVFYSFSSIPNWYYIGLIFYYFLFITAVCTYVLITAEKIKRIIAMTIIIIIGITLLLKPQFTIAAILLSFSAFLYLVYGVEYQSLKFTITGFAMFVLSVLIRFDMVFVFMLLFFLPLFFISYKKRNWSMTSVLVVIMALLFVNNYLEKMEMSALVGFDIETYVDATEVIIDYPASITEEALNKAGWNNSALSLMNFFFFADPDVFSFKKVKVFSEQVDSSNTISDGISVFWDSMSSNLYLVVFLLLLISIRRDVIKDKLTLYVVGASLFFFMFLSFDAKLPNRIVAPVLVSNICLVIIRGNFEQRMNWIFAGCLVFSIFLLKINIKTSDSHKIQHQRLDHSLSYFKSHADRLFQLTYFGFPFIAVAGFENKFYNHPCNILGFGWLIGTPAYYDHLKKFKIDNHLRAIINRNDILLVAGNERFRNALKRFAYDYYSRSIYYTRNTDTSMPVYDIVVEE